MPEAAEDTTTFRRDDRGRPIAEDGYPRGGNAHAKEAAVVFGVSVSTVYQMIADGSLESVAFGRARRVPWTAIRTRLQKHGSTDAGPNQ
jgi:excisionase family DNA binding protein